MIWPVRSDRHPLSRTYTSIANLESHEILSTSDVTIDHADIIHTGIRQKTAPLGVIGPCRTTTIMLSALTEAASRRIVHG